MLRHTSCINMNYVDHIKVSQLSAKNDIKNSRDKILCIVERLNPNCRFPNRGMKPACINNVSYCWRLLLDIPV